MFLLVCASITFPAFGSPASYLFITFTGEQTQLGSQVYFALSQDGHNWTSLNQSKPLRVSDAGERPAAVTSGPVAVQVFPSRLRMISGLSSPMPWPT
jgi:hypothetical protein